MNEWAFNVTPTKQPQRCLALSGGGIRSSAYSMGVMKGLDELGFLQMVDVISAVSGGGYAASWYYSQRLRDRASLDPYLFSDNSIKLIAQKADFIRDPNDWFLAVVGDFCARYSGEITVWPCIGISYPFSWVRSFFPPFGEAHQTDYGSLYASILGRTYLGSDSSSEDAIPNLMDIGGRLQALRMPLLIMNASLSDIGDERLAITDKIFEFTPIRIGSSAQGIGFVTAAELKDKRRAYPLHIVAAISGAAVDPTDTKAVLVFRGLDLRYNMKRGLNDTNEYFILTDGGRVDNLGAFSLIRRQCEHLVVVDAEYDPDYSFEAYERLNNSLAPYNMIFNVPGIYDWRSNKPSETQTTRNNAPQLGKCPGDSRTVDSVISFDCSRPVLKGHLIGCMERRNMKCTHYGTNHLADITYIKLSVNSLLLADPLKKEEVYGPHLATFINATDTHFPQYPTTDISWEESRFMAIFDLGYQAVMRNKSLLDSNSSKSATAPPKTRENATHDYVER